MDRRKALIPFLAFSVFLLMSLACGTSASPTLVATSAPPSNTESIDDESQEQDSTLAEQGAFKLGDIIEIGDTVLTVLGWENVPANDFSKPDSGKKFVAVELLLVNNGQSATSISTLLQTSMKDETGQKYDMDLMASTAMGSSSVDGELAPGEKVRGKIGFQISESASELQFVFDASIFGTGKVFVDLGPEPVTVAPPTELAGEVAQQIYHIGDVIEMGTVTISVNGVTNPSGDQFNKPSAGNKFLIVDVTIENKGATAISVSTLLQMSVKDANSQSYDIDLMASSASGGSTPDGEIAPGERLRGQVGFQIPEDSSDLVFVFDASVFGTGKVFVALS